MCGIAGLIHRGKSSNVGSELQGMLQALKHRGEDSTGYALYGDTDGKNFIMRFKVGENVGEGSSSIMEDVSVYDERKKIVDQYLSELGAKILKEERILPYSLRYELDYDVKDLLEFSQKIESIPGVEILSMGKSLEVIKDYVMKSLPSHVPDIEEIAECLNLSVRTVQRKLQDYDTSYSQVLDAIRKELALTYLRQTQNSALYISERLGFSEQSAFQRAFKRWTGNTPKKYRLQIIDL